MTDIIDIRALVRPGFEATRFTGTKWDTAADKAAFANDVCRFIAADFVPRMFTQKLYRRLALTFGHIAHCSREGFSAEFFRDTSGKVAFLEQTLAWVPCGDPAWTWCDIEHAVQERLRACQLLPAYRRRRAAEIDAAERELLRRLQAKFEPGAAPIEPPTILAPPPTRRPRVGDFNGAQSTFL
jgi:hypothetical protein